MFKIDFRSTDCKIDVYSPEKTVPWSRFKAGGHKQINDLGSQILDLIMKYLDEPSNARFSTAHRDFWHVQDRYQHWQKRFDKYFLFAQSAWKTQFLSRVKKAAAPGRVISADLVWRRLYGLHCQGLPGWNSTQYNYVCSPVTSLAVFPSGVLVAGHLNGRIQTIGGTSITINEGQNLNPILAVLPDERLAVGYLDGRICVINPDSTFVTLREHTSRIRCLTRLADGRLASASSDGRIRLFDLTEKWQVQTLQVPAGKAVTCLVACPEGGFVTGDTGNCVRYWDPQREIYGDLLERCAYEIKCIAISPDGRQITCGGGVPGFQCVTRLADGRFVYNIFADPNIRIRIPGVRTDRFRILQTGLINCLIALPDGDGFASGSEEGIVRIWRRDDEGLINRVMAEPFIDPAKMRTRRCAGMCNRAVLLAMIAVVMGITLRLFQKFMCPTER